MHWIAPSEKDTDTAAPEKYLWAAAEQAVPAPVTALKSLENFGSRPQGPVLGLISLRFVEGEIRHGGNVNSYYDDPHDANGRFDFVLANPPFNKTFLGFQR